MDGRHVVEVYLSVTRMKKSKDYRESQLAVMVAAICALLNSAGGILNLMLEMNPMSKVQVGDLFRRIEQCIVNIVGTCVYKSNVKLTSREFQITVQQWVLIVYPLESLCTVDYHIYLPTQKQVISVSPNEYYERVKALLYREVPEHKKISSVEFILNKEVPFQESDSIQFKDLKAESTKWVSLADRMTNKSNKLDRYISAFANGCGGQIFYGMTDGGIVKGEDVYGNYKEEIIKKVSKVINYMIWGGGKLERGKHWDIQFVPVKDENNNKIPSLFVIIVSVIPLPGGLFTRVPESYHVVQGEVERMSFAEWKRRLFTDEQPTKVMVPSYVGRTQWSSVEIQRICHKVLQQLLKYQNDGDSSNFEKYAAHAEQIYKHIEIRLVILAERSSCAYKKGAFQKANSLLETFEKVCSTQLVDDVFAFRAVYAKSAITRAEGDYQESYDIAQEGLQLAERIPAGIFTAWFYNHVAMVEKLLSQQTKDAERARLLIQSAQDHFIKALQHTQASSVEQEFSTTIGDLQQRIHIYRASALLGNFASGANFRKATPSDIKEAETDLSIYNLLLIQGHKETNYRKINYLVTLSDLRMCQWWQQRQLQTQEERSSEDGTPDLLKEAFEYATEAKTLSMKCSFEQLTNYAKHRLAVIIEVIIKLKVSSLRHPRNINDDK